MKPDRLSEIVNVELLTEVRFRASPVSITKGNGMDLRYKQLLGYSFSLLFISGIVSQLAAQSPEQPKTLRVDPNSAANRWRSQSISVLVATINRSRDRERLVLNQVRRSGGNSKKLNEQKKLFTTERTQLSAQLAAMRELEGEKLELAYQKALKAEIERQALAAKEQQKDRAREANRVAEDAADRARARQLFGDVELTHCPFCGPVRGLCNHCGGTGFAPKN